jgi:hypothetical protein
MFVSDTLWLCDVEWWSVCDLCMHVYLLCVFIFPAIESNDECAEEGEIFEYQEEGDQGQAIKASHLLDAYLNLNYTFASLRLILLKCMDLCCYSSYSNYCWLRLRESSCYHPSRWPPFYYLFQYLWSSGMLVSNSAFDKLSSGAKTLGLGTLKGGLQKCFPKTLG